MKALDTLRSHAAALAALSALACLAAPSRAAAELRRPVAARTNPGSGANTPRRTLAPRTSPAAARRGAPAAPSAPARPPRPRAALQLSGLRTEVPIARAAALHAIARDAWPALVACVGPTPAVRGYANVELSEAGRRVVPRVQGAAVQRAPALRACLERALSSLTLPPYTSDAPPPPVTLRFDLAFDMPSLL